MFAATRRSSAFRTASTTSTTSGRPLALDPIAAVVYVASSMPAPGRIKHAGRGDLLIGDLPGRAGPPREAAIARVSSLFEAAGVPCRVSPDIQADLWTKLITNVGLNGISAVVHATYGDVVAIPESRETIRALVNECVAVARAGGVSLPENDFAAMVLQFAERVGPVFASTAQDLERAQADRDRRAQRVRGAARRRAGGANAGQSVDRRAGETAGDAAVIDQRSGQLTCNGRMTPSFPPVFTVRLLTTDGRWVTVCCELSPSAGGSRSERADIGLFSRCGKSRDRGRTWPSACGLGPMPTMPAYARPNAMYLPKPTGAVCNLDHRSCFFLSIPLHKSPKRLRTSMNTSMSGRTRSRSSSPDGTTRP